VRLVIPRLGRPLLFLAAGVLVAAASGAALGYFMRFDLPDVRGLADYRPPVMTRVVTGDGALLDTFAEQRRILIRSRDIPPVFRHALLATEDSNFYRHTGIDFKGIARAAWRDLQTRSLEQGASTLTQQLARSLFLHRDKTFRRKIQEALLALEIERQYAKEEILGFYCNQVYMGHGRYGVEAAARYYFDVPARDLDLTQSAMLAGLLQRPESISPFRNPERALKRRNYVLQRMVDVGYLPAEQLEAAQATPIETASRDTRGNLAPYYVEEVRRWLQDRYGSSSLYTSGYTVRTTLDPALQAIANDAVDFGLRELEKRQGWRGRDERVPEGEDIADWEPESWEGEEFAVGEIHDGVVLQAGAESATVRLGPHTGKLGADAVAWTKADSLDDLFSPGDLIRVRVTALHEDGGITLELEQEPLVEGAMVALDPATGAVRALVGGHDFGRSEFNRAVQANRQTGSAFKPFVYAAALDAGWTLADLLLDEPTVFLDPRNPEPYQPENYKHTYYGEITLRSGLERSANISTVKLLDRIGYQPVIDIARRLGISAELHPFPSLALGSFEAKLLELTAAYGAFANQGVLVAPHLVEEVVDRDGSTLFAIEPEVTDAVSPQVAYLMNRVLAGVITDGTGRAAASLRLNLAGKTGTTDDNTDAWFIGYGPDLAVGVWVGFDEPRTLGRRETGAAAALPIWRTFMERAATEATSRQFPMPSRLTLVPIDRRTGLRANPSAYCNPVISEVFVEGTEPTESCSVYEHQRLRLPYSFQRFALSEHGELLLPSEALDGLLAAEPRARLTDGGRRIEVHLPEEVVSMAVRIVPEGGTIAADSRLEGFEPATWVGKDGREAEIVWMDGRPKLRASR
jgi:penicillin-binding protein 1A